MKKVALLLVDLQNDFFPRGALPTPQGETIIEPVNELISRFRFKSLPIIATRDWHPVDHRSFQEHGGPWPPHCVRGTQGAAFNPQVRLPKDAIVISKAESKDQEAYSGFEGTDLSEKLSEKNISAVVVGGLATDYCVRNTVLDALRLKLDVTVVLEAISGVEVEPGDSEKAIQDMVEKGARMIHLNEVSL